MQVKDEGALAIAALVQHSRTLQTVELPDVGIGPSSCKALGEAMERNQSITTLVLDHNVTIGDAGVAALGLGLRYNRTLTTLSLDFCGMTEAAGGLLAGGGHIGGCSMTSSSPVSMTSFALFFLFV